jgi:hypothetical protein
MNDSEPGGIIGSMSIGDFGEQTNSHRLQNAIQIDAFPSLAHDQFILKKPAQERRIHPAACAMWLDQGLCPGSAAIRLVPSNRWSGLR